MRLLANENVAGVLVRALRASGHDVYWIREGSPGDDDPAVLARATSERRVLLTFDRDFGELAFRSGLPADSGVVFCRFPPLSPEFVERTVLSALESRSDWTGNFAVIEVGRVRIRPLPR
jgi:predicted nuclease of predicted toxin-antitoxin system